MKGLDSFFSPKSIAVVGASPRKGKLGNVLIENIKKGGWKGKIYFVNPKYSKSRKDYCSNLSEIKKSVDLVLVAIPATFVSGILENGATAAPKIKNYAVISAGFKESGPEGKNLEENLKNTAKKHGLNILGPNCLGLANPKEKLNATFTDIELQEGKIAVVSQSGALAVALLDWAAGKHIGFSKVISIGNKTVLEESDILNFLARDKNTQAVALYLEDVKNGLQFMQALAKITAHKPVIILKAGKTSAGQKAISSHTGSLAQDEEIIEAVFEKMNVISADNIGEFQDIIYYLNENLIPRKKEIIVLTNAGGPGVMASDFIGKSEYLKLLSFPDDFKAQLKKGLPTSASVENPIDVIGDAPPERYLKTLEIIAKKYSDYSMVTLLTPQNQTDPEKVAQILAKSRSKMPNLSAVFMGGEKISQAREILGKNNIPNFENPERALSVIEKLTKYSQNKKNTRNLPNTLASNKGGNGKAEHRMLFWHEAERLFGKYGVKLAKSISFENIYELKSKKVFFPCALKTDDPRIAHRLEKSAVVLNIKSERELQNTFVKMKKTTGAKHFLVQSMADPGLELIIGMKRDLSFGPVILAGWGGSFTEIFKDKSILIPPLGQKEIRNKLQNLAIFPILKGFRGKSGYDLQEISKIIAAVAQISADNSEISEIDINPLVVYNNGKKGQILDAKIFLK